MPRYEQAYPFRGDQLQTDLVDAAFLGIDAKTPDPAAINPGWLSWKPGDGNIRIDNGCITTRPGCVAPVAFNSLPVAPIWGMGLFSDPFSVEYLLVASGSNVFAMRQGQYPTTLSLPPGITITQPCEMVQAFSVVVLFLGSNSAPLYWNGQWGSPFFTALPPPQGATNPTPNALTAEYYANRLFVPFGRDSIAATDLGIYYQYNAAFNQFLINAGKDDLLIRLFPWLQNQLICFKAQSTYTLQNVAGSLSQVSLQTLSYDKGLVARKAVVQVGSDVWFLDYSGIYSISQVVQASPQVSQVAVSDQIKNIIGTINWSAAIGGLNNFSIGAVAATRKERVYFAVPTGQNTRNNCLLVFNLINKAWESVDTTGNSNFFFDDIYRTDWNGEKRLFAIDKNLGTIIMLEEGVTDIFGNSDASEYQINDSITTRGYGGPGDRNQFKRLSINMASFNPNLSVSVNIDGPVETYPLATNVTYNPSKYWTIGTADWVTTNANADHLTPYRQDYSLTLPFSLGNGVYLNVKKERTHRYPIRKQGRFLQVNVSSTSGQIDIRNIDVGDNEGQRSVKGLP